MRALSGQVVSVTNFFFNGIPYVLFLYFCLTAYYRLVALSCLALDDAFSDIKG